MEKSEPRWLPSRISCDSSTNLDFISLNNLVISSVAAAAISWIPREDTGGHQAPTIIFRDQPGTFQAFVMLIMFGYSTSFSALYSYGRPKVARILRSCSVVFLSSAAVVLLFAFSRVSNFTLRESASN